MPHCLNLEQTDNLFLKHGVDSHSPLEPTETMSTPSPENCQTLIGLDEPEPFSGAEGQGIHCLVTKSSSTREG